MLYEFKPGYNTDETDLKKFVEQMLKTQGIIVQ